MSNYKYKVQKGDTLHKVALKFGISCDELRQYHNQYCPLEDLLPGTDKLPRHLKEILLPEGQLTYQEKLEKSLNTNFSLGKNNSYKIEIENSFFLKNELMSENQTVNLWKISEDLHAQRAEILVQEVQVIKCSSPLKALIDLVQQINKSSDHLMVSLLTDGTLGEVLNKKEIFEKWEAIKFEELKSAELQDDFAKVLIEEYNRAFERITPYIKQNMLYQVLFCPKKPLVFPVNSPRVINKEFLVNSLIFPELLIPYTLSYTSKEQAEEIEILLTSKSPSSHWELFKERYEKAYSLMLEDPFLPHFSLEGKYFYNKDSGTLNRAVVYAKEQMSKQLFYTLQYKINRIDQEEGETPNDAFEPQEEIVLHEKKKLPPSPFLFDE
ncbi:LysM peptidoglycan-binding domain-containing protein [Apibacter muscae]|uniref:LysM peptidoglycan-binding domain-containing protein n=1 Tax=Apibacter muscae TaxID=2509004 RepID=UPI0011ADB6FF|nr:LysM peptidoglycan-binding domain-containing protein [Apibacter muscae]TWP25097.1 LysM peptidoglycan-binding domain-containing protein [Apibacter muscae]